MAIRFCQNYVERKFEYIFFSDIDECKKYYFYRRYCDLVSPLAEIDYINTDHKKLDEKILETEAKIFRFRRQRKLLLRCLRELGDREARNIEDIQKTEKKTESRRNAIPDPFVPDNLFFIISKADYALAIISKK